MKWTKLISSPVCNGELVFCYRKQAQRDLWGPISFVSLLAFISTTLVGSRCRRKRRKSQEGAEICEKKPAGVRYWKFSAPPWDLQSAQWNVSQGCFHLWKRRPTTWFGKFLTFSSHDFSLFSTQLTLFRPKNSIGSKKWLNSCEKMSKSFQN